jgi:hypothetical protein
VHCTYLIRSDLISELTYSDESGRHEYVIFAESARKRGVPMYLDNRQVYGYIAFGAGHEFHLSNDVERAKELLGMVSRRQSGAPSHPIEMAGEFAEQLGADSNRMLMVEAG